MAVARVTRFALQNKARASPARPPPPARSPPCSPTPTSLLPDSLRIFLALVMCPVKSRNGNILRAEKAEPLWRARFGPCFIVICRGKAASEMKLEMNVVFCVLVVLTGSSQTGAQSSALPPALTLAAIPSHAGGSASPDLTEDPGNEVPQRTHNPAGRDETSAEATAEAEVRSETVTTAVHTTHMLTASSAAATSPHTTAPVLLTAAPGAPSPSAATDVLSSTPAAQTSTPPRRISTTEGRALLTRGALTAFSSQPASTLRDTSSTAAAASTVQPQSQSLTTATAETTATGLPLNSAPGRGPAGPTHRELLSELNVGDEDLKGPRSSSPLDPLLAGLLSVFIVTTAIVFVILFLKFRQRTNHPEFHRLQDLPMDDLMEDTPFSRYTY